jgi:mono/diheme cytochrome c family protein
VLAGPLRADTPHPVVPGFERFYSAGQDPASGGRLLLGELNCVSCHKPDAPLEANLLRKRAPILDGVAARIRRSYIRKLLADPQAVKPGITMPNVLAPLPQAEREQAIEALVHFLSSTGALKQERPQRKMVSQGRQLYNQVGCVACHGSRDTAGKPDRVLPGSVPLGDLAAKYSLASLAAFLENPHAVRPSGRMPGLLHGEEPRQVANYLLQGAPFAAPAPNLTFAYYEGSWERLPNFASLEPVATGKASGFDLGLAHRNDNMALRFQGYLHLEQDADYRFHLTSDDGSKLLIDDKMVVANDGIHPPSTNEGTAHLRKGAHRFEAAVFNAGGGVELGVQIEGGGLGRQDVANLLTLTESRRQKPEASADNKDEDFPIQPDLAARGKKLFSSLGCASCHQLSAGAGPLASDLKAPDLGKLRPDGGCLSAEPVKGASHFALSQPQRTALAAALRSPAPKERPGPAEVIRQTLTAFNCFACHERDKVGGIETDLNSFFTTTQQEMGEEGRVPPTLTGVGAKLNKAYVQHILNDGAHDRPYMNTRMPKFGAGNADAVVEAFAKADPLEPVAAVHFKEPLPRVKSEARKMVGAQMLGCVKCHTFAGHKAEGVQGIDMLLMPQRVRHDWYSRYLLDPQKLRPGTRMPTAWPNGQSVLDDVLDGKADKQIEAIWAYLSDGGGAALPLGLNQHFIPLVPRKEAIIYRNFIQGGGPRAIGVGFPEKAHLVFDANDLRLAMVWQGDFMDAARHWTDRGAGYEGPLGDNVLQLPTGVGFAVLDKPDQVWPPQPGRQLGYHFRGYKLTGDERPTFRYEIAGVHIEDTPNAVAGKPLPSIRRVMMFKADRPVDNIYFRALAADKIEDAGGGWYRVKGPSGDWKMKLEGAGKPRLRQSGGKTELLVPIPLKDGKGRLVQEFVW